MSLKLKVITGSTRPGRVGPKIAGWAVEEAKAQGAFEVEAVDLADIGLPLLDEPNHPAMQQYTKDHTKKWASIIADGDAYVFVTPEYDYFPPASLVNAIQVLAKEWNYKPAGIVSYAHVSGGLRAAQPLRELMANLQMVALPQVVPIPFFTQHIGGDGEFTPNDKMKEGASLMLGELAKWATALKTMR
ncbi:NADPH-dependent FMN reductase [Roseibium aggregatum]|uniref:NAD(P)H-dependent oxidoreductase n=1 Tax=Roseibium aggregatum TaxID=187304 RepID=A0A939EBX2_9HYPH|nr:NAD(P)H-dependent oxidoreductase [Roseibium aggregatum]MBN9669248.1 NAD(P)H-dependent oxidoreductase [Roseibium aggregatum]